MLSSFLRTLKLFQPTRAAMERPGFEKDLKTTAAAKCDDFVQDALHDSHPRTNLDLMRSAGNETVRTALRHLTFSTATVPLTDGYKMRCHHLGTAMNRVFGPLTVSTHRTMPTIIALRSLHCMDATSMLRRGNKTLRCQRCRKCKEKPQLLHVRQQNFHAHGRFVI